MKGLKPHSLAALLEPLASVRAFVPLALPWLVDSRSVARISRGACVTRGVPEALVQLPT